MKRVLIMALAVLMTPVVFASNGEIRRNSRAIKDQYIVVFRAGAVRDVPAAAAEMARMNGGRLGHVYSRALQGFSVELSEGRARALAKDPRVEYVEEDGQVTLGATQSNATWGLDRIDQRDLPLSGSYTYNYTGSGVKAYIIDTGILASHNEFGGRVVSGYTAISDGRGTTDCNGHGTHVAGTVGGATYGVARSVTLVPVRVLDCNGSGTNSGVIAGVDWVTSNHGAGQPAVANMSLGGGASSALDTAVNNSINDGVTYAVASGNDNKDACNYSPARVAAAITVNSSTSSDARSSFSNWGTCTDIFAPGSSITSAWYTSNTATNTISGTSMATPHVAGVGALYLQSNTSASPSTVWAAIRDSATLNKITSAGSGSPNRLLYSLLSSGGGGTTTQLLSNPGFESGNNGAWTTTSGVITNSTSRTPQAGSWYAWLCGYGSSHTDYAYQQISIPSGATAATLNFYLKIDTAETTTSTAYDKMSVQILNSSGSLLATLATYSNLNKSSSYSLKSFDLLAYKGQTIRVRFYATEDSIYQTSFLVDTTSLNVTQ
ncbi:MAG TPA: S8 family serine peptidase [Thermoanaerobaculia bacterium]|nr:S8 family serine peptidase [Thermoanaerobaculia bacterium]